jgi:uncharacterized protein (TIGR00369 family)
VTSRRIEQARARFARVPFAGWLGVTVADLSDDHAVLVLPARAAHLNAGGVLNGGASASLLAMAGTLAAWTGIDLDADPGLRCVDLSVQYLARAGQEDVVAEARVLRRGRSLTVLDVALTARAGEPICRGLLSYHTSDHGPRPPRLDARHAPLPAPDPLVPPPSHRLFRGYVQQLGIGPLHRSPGRVRVGMPCTPILLDERGQLHAGALASIADIAAVAASWSLVARGDGMRGSTIGMQLSFPGAAAAAVVADAHVQHRSDDLLFNTVHVTTEASGQLVALGQVSYRLVEPWPDEPPSRTPAREGRGHDATHRG